MSAFSEVTGIFSKVRLNETATKALPTAALTVKSLVVLRVAEIGSSRVLGGPESFLWLETVTLTRRDTDAPAHSRNRMAFFMAAMGRARRVPV